VYVCGHLRGASLAEVFAAEGTVSPAEVTAELRAIVDDLAPAVRARTWIDPGVGFGKGADPATNVALCREAGAIAHALGCPVVVGPSRKRYLARLTGSTREADLDAATVGACLAAVAGGAHVLRVHNVRLLVAALIA
jgi:dihydropteroate synthase